MTTIACSELDPLLAERASAPPPEQGAPADPARAALDAHLQGCERCRAALAAYQAAFDLARAVPPAERAEATARPLSFDLAPLLRAGDPARGWRRATYALSGGLLAAAAAAALVVTGPGLPAHRGVAPAAQPAATAPARAAATSSAGYQPGVDEAVAAAAAYGTASARASSAGMASASAGDDDGVATALLEAYDDAGLY